MHFINRSYDIRIHTHLIPLLVFWDFAAAFPSVAHDWIFLTLTHRGFPEWFINAIKGIYHNACAYANCGGDLTYLFQFLSGVLQGCPASAFLFNIALDPFLHAMGNAFRKKKHAAAVTRACADDIGQALRALKHLKVAFPIFEQARNFAGLNLKPAKCKLIPLVENFDVAKSRVEKWLHRNIPEWEKLEITDAAIYLGFFLGPKAKRSQWLAPTKKSPREFLRLRNQELLPPWQLMHTIAKRCRC